MAKSIISKMLDNALSKSFYHHIEHSPAPITPKNVNYCELQAKFIDSLSVEQQETYKELDAMCAEVETEENEHYYRLGFHDGLAAWRSV